VSEWRRKETTQLGDRQSFVLKEQILFVIGYVLIALAFLVLGLCLLRLDRKDDGIALLRDGARRAESLGVMAYLSRWMLHLAEGLLATGDTAAARVAADRAMALALTHGERAHEAMAWRVLGDVSAR